MFHREILIKLQHVPVDKVIRVS